SALREQNAGANELREHQAFPALPRLELPAHQEIECLLRLARVIEQRGKFHGEVVALFWKIRVTHEFRETHVGRNSGALPKLVALKENACVARISGECVVEGYERGRGVALDVEVCDTKIPLCCHAGRIKRGGLYPLNNGVRMASAVIEKIAKVQRCPGVARVRSNSRLEH